MASRPNVCWFLVQLICYLAATVLPTFSIPYIDELYRQDPVDVGSQNLVERGLVSRAESGEIDADSARLLPLRR